MRVFDFDNTLYRGESAFDFFLFSIRYNPAVVRYVPVVTYNLVKYKLGKTTQQDLEQGFRRYAHEYMASFDDPEGLVMAFWDKHICKIKNWYRPQPDDVVITANFDVIVEEACRRIGIANCISSTIDRESMTVTYINFNHNKQSRFRELMGADAVVDEFYTDSAFDKPMMQLARTAYLVKGDDIKRIK